jgi:hypothetical protein
MINNENFKIRTGLSTDLFNSDGSLKVSVVLELGCWYLCSDTLDIYICVKEYEQLVLKALNSKNTIMSLNEWLNSAYNLSSEQEGARRLSKGEIALVQTDNYIEDAEGNTKNIPNCLMKIGDGSSSFSELDWLIAPSSDVYPWAKASDIIYDTGILTLKKGNTDGSDIIFNFTDTFYTKDTLDTLLADKAPVDHGRHLVFPMEPPKANGKATVGVSDAAARADHVHPTDETRAPVDHTHPSDDSKADKNHIHDDTEIYLQAPNGYKYRITVDNDGILSTSRIL